MPQLTFITAVLFSLNDLVTSIIQFPINQFRTVQMSLIYLLPESEKFCMDFFNEVMVKYLGSVYTWRHDHV